MASVFLYYYTAYDVHFNPITYISTFAAAEKRRSFQMSVQFALSILIIVQAHKVLLVLFIHMNGQ